MRLHFVKYQATGNDFVLLDNRDGRIKLSAAEIQRICDRRFGVGADGLMLLEKHATADFNLQYYNSDGSQSLCGNGTRAAVKMAASLGMIKTTTSFDAYDGRHEAEISADGIVKLKMNDVSVVKQLGADFFINTGSPHLIRFVDDASAVDVVAEGRNIRYSEDFKPGGTNVNFVQLRKSNTLFVRTYERGVENETLSCGTGVTAAALAAHFNGFKSPVGIETPGGQLSVQFTAHVSGQAVTFQDIFLIGPAKMVFEGDLEL